ncbi:MAG: chromate transporter [Alphaproteobacteria bacterium]|nr:chromate transporter [Alphaproteobacteria bacterium]
MSWSEIWPICLHFCGVSLMAVGGAISALPEMHRFLVEEHQYLSDDQFVNSVALGQIAPGPNVMFVALMGWNMALHAQGGLGAGWAAVGASLLFALACLACVLLPSSFLTYNITQWLHRERERLGVRAFKSGMAPIVIGLMTSTGWLMQARHDDLPQDWGLWLLMTGTVWMVLRTRVHLLWLLAMGAALGLLGWV